MKIRKVLSVIAAAAVAVATFAVSASAYELNKDLKTGWSISTTVPGSEFEGITEDSVITITYTADPSLADMPGHEYWVIKPMINDAGWPLVENIKGLTPSEDGSSYVVPVDGTEIKFCFPAADIEHIQIAGLAFMGHGITLGELTISNDETLPEAAPEATVEEEVAVEEEAAPEEEVSEPAVEETASEAAVEEEAPKGGSDNPTTGVGLSTLGFVLSAATVAVTKKRK